MFSGDGMGTVLILQLRGNAQVVYHRNTPIGCAVFVANLACGTGLECRNWDLAVLRFFARDFSTWKTVSCLEHAVMWLGLNPLKFLNRMGSLVWRSWVVCEHECALPAQNSTHWVPVRSGSCAGTTYACPECGQEFASDRLGSDNSDGFLRDRDLGTIASRNLHPSCSPETVVSRARCSFDDE